MKVRLTASSGDFLILTADKDSYYEDSIEILQSLGFTYTRAAEFLDKRDDLELEIVSPGKIQYVQQLEAEHIKISEEAIEYNPLASIV